MNLVSLSVRATDGDLVSLRARAFSDNDHHLNRNYGSGGGGGDGYDAFDHGHDYFHKYL